MASALPTTHVGQIAVIKRLATTTIVALGCCWSAAASAEYLLSPGDVLEISVVGLRDMQQTIAIDVDGEASFPLIGPVKAAGTSLAELQQKIRGQLPGKIFRRRTEDGRESQVALSPDEIRITVSEYRPIYLNGDVAKPGAQSYRAGMTVRQAIALAGGFDTMRFRSRDPFLEAADFRADYYSLWTEFAKQQVRVARLKAELADQPRFDRRGFTDTPIPSSVVARIEELEARALTSRNDDHANERAYLQHAIEDQDRRVAVLGDDAEKEKDGAQADIDDFKDMQEKFKRGLIPMSRLSDARRFTLFSASQALQTAAQLAQARRERGDLGRSLQRVDDQRRIDLLKELQDAEVTLETIRSRLQAVGDKLMYTGVVKSQLVRGAGGTPDVKIFRDANNLRQVLRADENDALLPGDVIEVALRLEGLTSGFRSDQEASQPGH
jgi:polysaccharide biosynthesis/export protein